ncbi:MAG: HXXEE domain-containing protein [Candidatus Cyclobacteriaceae bacterium M3_2C_046]
MESVSDHIKRLFWFIPISFTLHNAEEILGMDRNGHIIQEKLSSLFPGIFPIWLEVSPIQFIIAVSFLTLLVFVISIFMISSGNKTAMIVMMVLGAGLLINGVNHLLQSLVILGYVPGLITAVGFFLPLGIYLFIHALKHGIISRRKMIWIFLAGLLLNPLLTISSLGLSRIIINTI